MAATRSIIPPFAYYTDLDGGPLESGYVYIGEKNKNPEVYPIDVYWDQGLTIVAAQPIRTINGYPSRNGSPGSLFVDTDYSTTVRTKNLALVYSAKESVEATDIAGKIDFSYIETTTHDMISDADYTLTASENTYGRVIITDVGVVLSTARNIIVGTSQRRLIVQNDTAQTLTFKTAAGTGIAVLAGEVGDLYSDGTNIIEATNKVSERYLQTVTHNITTDANYTLTSLQNTYGRIIITDSGAVLTTGRSIIVDTSQRRLLVQNDTAQALTFKTAAGTGVGVAAARTGDIYCDGTNVITAATTSEIIIVSDQKATTVNGGTSVTGDQTRTLNTVEINEITGASLATNTVTLPAGTYEAFWSAPAYRTRHRCRLRNTTDGINYLAEPGYVDSAVAAQTTSIGSAKFTIAASKDFTIIHNITTAQATTGLGVACLDGLAEVYTRLVIRKVG